MIAEIHCSPNPSGTPDSKYAHIDAAIAEAQSSGHNYEVGALGTTIEGRPDELWALLRSMHEATMKSGAASIITNIRIAEHADGNGPQIETLVSKFRTGG